MRFKIPRNAAWLILYLCIWLSMSVSVSADQDLNQNKIVGIYVHQHWPYNHPYAARSWTFQDWAGYIDGLQRLGFNTVKIWPMLETMPKPLTESDIANLDKLRQVIDMIHAKGMRAIIVLCPNIIADSAVAKQMTFEDRYYFYSDLRVDPADAEAVRSMMQWREELFRPLAQADAVAIIDSDPGGYPGSNNQEFVDLLMEHRKMFDRLRPGIELLYWVHAGWPGYCRYYETANFAMSEESEILDAIQRLKAANPEPWGLAGHIHYAKQADLLERGIDYRYGWIEAEPAFPLTNFGGDNAYKAGQGAAGRGVMGNAQTHCLQLPNTFAFARGAQNLPLSDADYLQFANDLIPGHGADIVSGWSALWEGSSFEKLAAADKLETISGQKLGMGPLAGLLFGDPNRFLMDIVFQLRLQAACQDFCKASEAKLPIREPFRNFAAEFARWQQRHGYEGRVAWTLQGLDAALDKLDSPEIDAARRITPHVKVPFARVKNEYVLSETATARLVDAMNKYVEQMDDADN